MHALTQSFRSLPVLLLILACAPVEAQTTRTVRVRTWPVDSVLARFETDIRANVVNSVGWELVSRILALPDSYAARRDSLLNGLERLALTSGDQDVRRAAARRVASVGQVGRTAPPLRNVMPRLLRIYRGNTDWGVRAAVLDAMPSQAERSAAAALLRSVAAEPDSSGGRGPHGYFSHGDLRLWALARLAEMGEEGRAVLQAMHRSGEARSPQARILLEDMARRGFPVRDIARRQP